MKPVMPGDRERPAADGKPQGQSGLQERRPGTVQPSRDAATSAEVEDLAAADRRVRAHEQAHMAAGGSLVRGGPVYEYRTGPDGQRYAVSGEVALDASPVSGNPLATIRKAERVKRAALAPADPSPQDRRVAAQAEAMANKAQQELSQARMGNGPARPAGPAAPSPDAQPQDKPAVKTEEGTSESSKGAVSPEGGATSPNTESAPSWELPRAVIREEAKQKGNSADRTSTALPGRLLPSAYGSAASQRVTGFDAMA
jgi:hypothetical protein